MPLVLTVENRRTRPRPEQSIRPSSAALRIFQWAQSAITHSGIVHRSCKQKHNVHNNTEYWCWSTEYRTVISIQTHRRTSTKVIW